jgi:ABC-type transport system involved in Fe-S cluster assembly fused permease/ATPase subunit
VKQHAFAEMSETTFRHLLGLSLDWHLKKKMGEVIRVMDRGISSADSVMNYLVLFLAPSVAECFVTIAIFASRFKSPTLSATTFLSFAFYTTLTVQITQWRKKFRQNQNKQDNKYHDLATDCLTNFETVKYFANEEYEVNRYRQAVRQFQTYNVSTQASLSLLNSTQQLDIQVTTLIALCLAASSVLAAAHSHHEPIQIGTFVSVNAYVMQLFTPLSFLGTIYSAVIQAFATYDLLLTTYY